MTQIIIYTALIVFGLCFGSFAGATVWRLRFRQLNNDKKTGKLSKLEQDEYNALKKLNQKDVLDDRSRCLHCSYQLRWYDLLPLVSWISLGGKCRKCHQKIGFFEPLMELAVAAFFLISYIFWPHNLNSVQGAIIFVLWLILGIVLAIAFAYDAKWLLIPDCVNFAIIGLGVVNAIVSVIYSTNKADTLVNILASCLILSGLYFLIYVVSRGKWVGFGDIKLGLGLALFLVNWELSFIALFLANLIGCLAVLPAMLSKKLKRDSQVPFGPFFIIGFILASLFGSAILKLYYSLML